jgi:diguanylate cyclase (GGDEF)-like protein
MSDGRARVLIVDDQPANVRVLGEALKDRYELCFATSGERALGVLDSQAIDLVLLDVTMPELDGFEVCRRLKADARTQAIPVIFVTARDETDDEARGFEVGGVDYITKPISPPIVRARVRTHLELKRARDLLEQMASVDALTGIANRRRFDAALEHEWRRAVRGSHWLTLALVDVDYFKKYNDRYGHGRGDECLRAVAGALGGACRRPADLVARYGGEEFGLVLPETDPLGARSLVGSLVERVRALGIEHAASACAGQVSVSVGAASLVPKADADIQGALEEADKRLYEAKQAGRARGVHVDLASGDVAHLLGSKTPTEA